MSNWRKISEFITFSTKGITPKYVENSSIIVLNQKCIRNGVIDYSFSQFTDDTKQISETKFVNKGDILINSTGVGTAGRCAFVEELPINKRLITDSHILLLRCNNYFEARCLSYLLFSFEKTLMSFMTGSSGQGELDKVVVLNLLTRLPVNSETQQKIAKVLSDLDAKIDLNNKINAELEAMAKTLYDYWFVQFDFPDANGKPYKSSKGKMVWNEDLKREIPEGWEVKSIGDYCKSTGGFAFKSSWWSDKGLKVVKIKDIQEDNTISLNDLSYADILSDKIGVNFLAKPGNVLIAMTGATVGKFAIVPFTNEPLFVNQRVGYFNLGKNPIDKLPFLINSLNQKYFRDSIFTLASGAAQPNISNEQINNIPLILPKIELILNFNSSLSSSYSKILNNQKENQELASLRDWLLPMLMNGQVSVGSNKVEENEV
jgi:type I restriction enzyme S subunit